MGQPQITQKLSREVELFNSDKYEFTDKDIVYFFVEARKLLEQTSGFRKFPAIKFYADWIVHPRKDRSAPDYVKEIFSGLIKQEKMNEFIEMRHLKEELERFVKEYGIAAEFLTESKWELFWNKLAHVLSEQPLELNLTVSKFVFYVTEENTIRIEYDHT